MSTAGSTAPPPAPLYFPKAGSTPRRPSDDQRIPLPERPQEVGPVFDSRSSTEPLEPFDDTKFGVCYTISPDRRSVAPIPGRPADFDDSYLYPMLSRNERLRLTMLWYHTRDLVKDHDLLYRLQEKVNLVKEFIGWDFAICGMVDDSTYQRLATANLPLAILPRRESTCSHTILQDPDVRADVHTLRNDSDD